MNNNLNLNNNSKIRKTTQVKFEHGHSGSSSTLSSNTSEVHTRHTIKYKNHDAALDSLQHTLPNTGIPSDR